MGLNGVNDSNRIGCGRPLGCVTASEVERLSVNNYRIRTGTDSGNPTV